MADLFGASSGVLYQNETSKTVIVTIGARSLSGNSTVRFSPTGGGANEVNVVSGGVEFRTYQIGPGQGIQADTGGDNAYLSLEINAVVSGD